MDEAGFFSFSQDRSQISREISFTCLGISSSRTLSTMGRAIYVSRCVNKSGLLHVALSPLCSYALDGTNFTASVRAFALTTRRSCHLHTLHYARRGQAVGSLGQTSSVADPQGDSSSLSFCIMGY